jgi:hypothetical protein
MNNVFGFTQPGATQQFPFYMQQNPMQYQGAMPAGMFGPGASPMGAVPQGQQTQGMNPMMQGLGMVGSNMLQQAQNHQQPASIGGALMQSAPALMGMMARNPQMQQSMQNGMQGLMGMFGGGAGTGA